MIFLKLCCYQTHFTNLIYRPTFSDLNEELKTFLTEPKSHEQQFFMEQQNETYDSETDIIYGEIQLVKMLFSYSNDLNQYPPYYSPYF